MARAPAARNQIRLIGGQWRSRKLSFADLPGLRPTTDRVKETVFNWLMHKVPGSHCLDAFSGSGSLGFEALSREAAWTTFIDSSNIVVKQLQANLKTLQCQDAEVIRADSIQWLSQTANRQFDLVFLDPPFNQGLLEPAASYLESRSWLTADAVIYIEYEQKLLPQLPANWQCIKEKRAGEVIFALYQRNTA
ncbi:16S rRNA (guanine(966)-N(2))-methyltransferase RsmD [Pokkaliibacter sp. CJK22405]|uniref:16S rRNA (guanine(966)-N(2))-methyltransferase RsmD n=1 Tax=Pokkaliibacter sp. CJK22405 TaxID=3384615 RepID=UPI003984C4D1